MQTHRLGVRAAFMAMAIIATACAAKQDAGETVGQPVDGYDGLLAALRGNGSTVESLDSISQPFFVPEGQVIRVDGSEVQVFEFSNEGDAQSTAETISTDGSSIGTTMISWVEAPHFYKSGKLIVLYVDEENALVEVLTAVLGPQFAGADSVEGPSMETEPPAALLQIGGEEQISGIGSYCWTDPNAGIALCADYFGVLTPADPLPASSSITATLQLAVQTAPTSLSLAVFAVSPEMDLLPENPDSASWPFPGEYDLSRELRLESRTQFEMALDPGLYVFSIFAAWERLGDVNYGFLVEVR